MSISLNGDDLVKSLARITYKANIPCCDLAERLIKEFREEVVGSKYKVMFLIMDTWREVDILNDADKPIQNSSNQHINKPECSFPGPDFINDLVLVDECDQEDNEPLPTVNLPKKKRVLSEYKIQRSRLKKKKQRENRRNRRISDAIQRAKGQHVERIERATEDRKSEPPKKTYSVQSWRT